MGLNKKKIDKLTGTYDIIWDQNSRWKSSYNDYCLKVGDEVGLIYGFVYDGIYSMDEFYFDPTQNLQALPWGSTAVENGTSKDAPFIDENGVEHPKTIINQVSGSSNSGIATLPGKIKFKDLDGDGYITENDRTVIGNTNPKVQGGFGLSGQWKSFDFTMNFNYMLDFDVNNAMAYTLALLRATPENSTIHSLNLLTKDGVTPVIAMARLCTSAITLTDRLTCTVN